MATNPTAEAIRALFDGNNELVLRVIPGARIEKAAIENGALKIWTRTAAEDGKANKAVLARVASLLNLSADAVTLLTGHHSRDKRVRISG